MLTKQLMFNLIGSMAKLKFDCIIKLDEACRPLTDDFLTWARHPLRDLQRQIYFISRGL